MIAKRFIVFCFSLFLIVPSFANQVALSVWANEAIVATYTFSHKNFIQRQKEIAKYFTQEGWMAYSKALLASKLPETVKKNAYTVSSVALLPPEIQEIEPKHWQAIMPLLVVYKNPQYQQKQTLEVSIDFKLAPPGQGVRGLAIQSLRTKEIKAPCKCCPQAKNQSEHIADNHK